MLYASRFWLRAVDFPRWLTHVLPLGEPNDKFQSLVLQSAANGVGPPFWLTARGGRPPQRQLGGPGEENYFF